MKNRVSIFFVIFYWMVFTISCSNSNESSDTLGKNQSIKESSAKERYSLYTTECLHTDLSAKFNFKIKFWRYTIKEKNKDSCFVKINIIHKNTNEIADSISLISEDFMGTGFNACTYGSLNETGYRTTSYITGKDTTGLTIDNLNLDYGDIVIADLNFDGREDLALIKDWGKGRGVCYNYYIQNNNHQFKLDSFLTHTMKLFLYEINRNSQSLTTKVESGTCGHAFTKHIYKRKENNWQEISRLQVGNCY